MSERENVYIKHKWSEGKESRVGPYYCDGLDALNKRIYEASKLIEIYRTYCSKLIIKNMYMNYQN